MIAKTLNGNSHSIRQLKYKLVSVGEKKLKNANFGEEK